MNESELRQACIEQEHEITGLLGEALYGISDEGLPLWGDHVAVTLAMVAARRLREVSAAFRYIIEYPFESAHPEVGAIAMKAIAKDVQNGSPTADQDIQDARRYRAIRNHSQVMDPRMDGTGIYRIRTIPGRFTSFEAAVDSLVKQEDDHANRPRPRLDDASQARADDAAARDCASRDNDKARDVLATDAD